jgi:PPP family 3-phenylpropionic acid transporter
MFAPRLLLLLRTPLRPVTALRAFYFLFYGFYGVIIPYLPLWLARTGLDEKFVGFVIAAAFLPKIVSAPLIAHIADVHGRSRGLLVVVLLCTLASLLLLLGASAEAWFFALTMAVNFFAPAAMPLMDRAAMAQSRAGASLYTSIRLCGSLGFAVFSLVGGLAIGHSGANGVIWLGGLLALLCIGMALRLPATPAGERAAAQGAGREGAAHRYPLLDVLRNTPVLWCIVASGLVQASNGYLYSYSTLYWSAQGISTSAIGLLWAVGIASEIVFFLFAQRVLARINPVALILLSAAMTALRWVGMGLTTDVGWLGLFQLLQCFTLAGNNAAIMAFLAKEVDAGAKTTAIALYTLLSAGLLMFLSINIVNLLDLAGDGGFFVMAACAGAAVPLMWRLGRRRAA